jgi:hypothetical protein
MDQNPRFRMLTRLAEELNTSLETVLETLLAMSEVDRALLVTLLQEEKGSGGPRQSVTGDEEESLEENVTRSENIGTKTNYEAIYHSETDSVVRDAAVEADEKMNRIYRSLELDSEKVKSLLRGSEHENIDDTLISAYLEAHLENPSRVQVVVDELTGEDEEMDSSSGQLGRMSPDNPEKGKGKGKSSKAQVSRSSCDPSEKGTKRRPSPRGEESGARYKRRETADMPSSPMVSQSEPSSSAASQEVLPALCDTEENLVSPPVLVTVDQVKHSRLLIHPSPVYVVDVVTGAGTAEVSTAPLLVVTDLDVLVPGVVDPADIPAGPSKQVKQVEIPITRMQYSVAELSLADGLSDMFPSTPVKYLRSRCKDLEGNETAMERFTLELLDNPQPPHNWRAACDPSCRTETDQDSSEAGPSSSGLQPDSEQLTSVQVWERERWEQLQAMFPHLCPDHLRGLVEDIAVTEELRRNITVVHSIRFQQLVERLWAPTEILPTRNQWKARRRERLELEKWAEEMTASRFLEVHTDPQSYFSDIHRVSPAYSEHSAVDLMERFPFQTKAKVLSALNKHKLYIPAVRFLQDQTNTRMTRRTRYEIKKEAPRRPISIEFLKEKKYLELKDSIAQLKKERAMEKEARMAAARKDGLLLECVCCCSEDCLEEEMIHCRAGHLFCRECVFRAAVVVIGDNKTVVQCLGQCQQEIDWLQLSKALDPVLLSKLLQSRQAEEVSEAGLEGLVSCPFCPYQTIMEGEEDRVLVCRNPDCGRESCRLCMENNHVPLRCDEVEKTDEVRKKIEEKLTLAMMRECWKCKIKVFR